MNRLKAVAAIGVRNPIRTHFPKTIKSGSVSNYELHTDSNPPKGQVGHLWILSETSWSWEWWISEPLCTEWAWSSDVCSPLYLDMLSYHPLSSINTTWLICLLSKKCHGLKTHGFKEDLPEVLKISPVKKNSLEWLPWRLLILQYFNLLRMHLRICMYNLG